MDPRIVAVSGPLKGQVFRLAEGRVSVGREPTNRMPIRDVTISRQHCVIELQDGAIELTDLESHNGTFVNGIPVSKRALLHGDVVRVGQCELNFSDGSRYDRACAARLVQRCDDHRHTENREADRLARLVPLRIGSGPHGPGRRCAPCRRRWRGRRGRRRGASGPRRRPPWRRGRAGACWGCSARRGPGS